LLSFPSSGLGTHRSKLRFAALLSFPSSGLGTHRSKLSFAFFGVIGMPRSRYRILDPNQPHFLTCTILMWLPVFTRRETTQIVLDSWKYLQEHRDFRLFGFVILENHLHLIAASPDLGKDIHDFKSFTAREIINVLKQQRITLLLDQFQRHKARHKKESEFQVWQEGSHPELIQGREMMLQKLEYIHNNPVERRTSTIR
jgi:REP element-mobilizing transposase RayT